MLEYFRKVWRAASAIVSVAERLWQVAIVVFGLTGATVLAWLTQTWAWYWDKFNWAGTAFAFIVAYFILSFSTLLLSVASAIHARRNRVAEGVVPPAHGPLDWQSSLAIAGPLEKPYAIVIRGSNIGARSVTLREAYISSFISGRRIDMTITAAGEDGQSRYASIEEVNEIPPGARIELIANVADPGFGLSADDFLKDWARFQFCAVDSVRTYEVPFNESVLSVFYPSAVGPRVTMREKV